MRKFLRFLTQRVVLTALLIVIQALLLFGIIWKLNNYFVYFYAASVLLSLLLTLRIINNKSNPAFKIAWLIPILLFPVLGGLVYLVFGSDRTGKYIRNKMGRIEKEMQDGISKANERSGIEKMPPDVVNQSHYISNSAHCPPYKNTTVEYLPMGEVKFERMVQELKKAKRYIFMEYFIIQEGTMWNTILDVLEEKAKEGVDVRVIYDDMGCILTLPTGYEKTLREKGIQCQIFNPFIPILSSHFNTRDHRKICVIDGNVGFTGGINLADEYINEKEKHGHWKDTAVLLRGQGVQGLTEMFLELWQFTCQEKLHLCDFLPSESFLAPGFVQPYGDSPLDSCNLAENVYMQILNHARDYVYITTPYLILDNEMLSALCLAAQSGVDVRIITPHVPDKWYVHMVTRSYYQQLLSAGVRIFEYTPGFIHAKMFVSDNTTAVVGTTNVDFRSFYLHFECGVAFYLSPMVAQVRDDILKTQNICEEITLQKVRAVRAPIRVLRSLLRAFAPLM